MSESVKHRRKLNTEQLEVLELLSKFRFGSNNLIAEYFGKKDRSFVFKRLTILLEQGLIGKRFDSSYRIRGMSAAYYLLPDGARILSQHRESDDDEVNVKAIYKDKTLQESFVQHCFKIFSLYNQLMEQYGDGLDFLTKSDLAGSEHLPRPLPDAFLTLEEDESDTNFFLDVFEGSQPPFVINKRIKQYISYKQSGDWAVVGGAFPTIMLVCESEKLCKQAQERADTALKKTWQTGIKIIASTKDTVELSDIP